MWEGWLLLQVPVDGTIENHENLAYILMMILMVMMVVMMMIVAMVDWW